MVAAEHPYAPERALWSGPVDAAGQPEGVGCFDYAAYHGPPPPPPPTSLPYKVDTSRPSLPY